MSALDELILDFDIDKPHAMRTRHGMAENARAELAQLRAQVAEQARRLEEARKLEQYVRALNDYEIELTACPVCDYPPIVCECAYVAIRAWLAANPATAPQAEQEHPQ